jgi:hypothetical protein
MKMLLTEQQVKRLIELLKQNQASGDEELIRHLEMHLNLEQAWLVNLDEIPF